MRSCQRIIWPGLCLVLAGCGGGQLITVKDEKIASLEEKNSTTQQALDATQSRMMDLESRLESETGKKDEALAQSAAVDSKHRETQEALGRVSAKNIHLTTRIVETERAYDELKKTLKNVQNEAARLVEEVSERRLSSHEIEDRMTSAKSSVENLRRENRSLRSQTDRLKDDLKRKEVALQAVRSAQPVDAFSNAKTVALEEKIRTLEVSARAHQADRIELHGQIEELKKLLPESAVANVAELAASARRGALYENDPRGLWGEVSSFVRGRYGAMTSGEASWDAIDMGMLGCGSLFLLALVWGAWTPFRWKKRRKVRDEVAHLRGQVELYEQRGSSESRRRPRRRNQQSVVRRNQFSPMLTTQDIDLEEEEEEEAPSSAEAVADAPVFQESTTRAAASAPRGRQVIGAHQWEEDEEGVAEEDQFQNTQVIDSISPEDLVGPDLRDPLAGSILAPAIHSGSPSPAARHDDEEEFGNTQIIQSLDDIESLGAAPSPVGDLRLPGSEKPKAETSSKDLMSELEDLIGKKVDEIIQ